jgi:phage shock protein A
MPLFRRIADIVSANLNEMVDRFEDPEKMLRQAVREMERAVGSALDRAVAVVAQEKLLARQVSEVRRQAELWHRRAAGAVQAGDDSLARRALVRFVEHQRLAATLEEQQASASGVSCRLRREIEALREKLAEAKRRVAVLTASRQVAKTRTQLLAFSPRSSDFAGAASLDRWMGRVCLAEAEAEAWCELTGAADDDALETMDNACVEEELASLKLSLNK